MLLEEGITWILKLGLQVKVSIVVCDQLFILVALRLYPYLGLTPSNLARWRPYLGHLVAIVMLIKTLYTALRR